jgi:hypothetical protein
MFSIFALMTTIKSKFAAGFFAGIVLVPIFILAFIIVLIYNISGDVYSNFQKPGVWIIVCLLGAFIFYSFYLFVNDFKEMTIDEKGILIRNSIKKKQTFIDYDSIARFYVKQVTASLRSPGESYCEFYLELKNGKVLVFSQNTYANFLEIKNFIYKQLEQEDADS